MGATLSRTSERHEGLMLQSCVCQDGEACLSSMDGRPYAQVAGLKARFLAFLWFGLVCVFWGRGAEGIDKNEKIICAKSLRA